MKPDTRQALRVFDKITRHGDKHGEEYRLDGLVAIAEQDGYTIVIRDEAVTLRIFFHHSFDLECDNREAWETFNRRLERVDKTRYNALSAPADGATA